MAEEKKPNVMISNMIALTDPDNFQKYIMGTKKNGSPRAVYDIVKELTGIGKKDKKKKKKKKKHKGSGVPEAQISLYMTNRKKKKKKKYGDHWHI